MTKLAEHTLSVMLLIVGPSESLFMGIIIILLHYYIKEVLVVVVVVVVVVVIVGVVV